MKATESPYVHASQGDSGANTHVRQHKQQRRLRSSLRIGSLRAFTVMNQNCAEPEQTRVRVPLHTQHRTSLHASRRHVTSSSNLPCDLMTERTVFRSLFGACSGKQQGPIPVQHGVDETLQKEKKKEKEKNRASIVLPALALTPQAVAHGTTVLQPMDC